MNKNQIMNLLGAGTMTLLIVITGLLFNAGVIGSASADSISSDVQTVMMDGEAAVQAENAQLREAIVELQNREAQYAQQIDQANQLLQEQNTAATYGGEYEEEEHEEEEHEEGEYGAEAHEEEAHAEGEYSAEAHEEEEEHEED